MDRNYKFNWNILRNFCCYYLHDLEELITWKDNASSKAIQLFIIMQALEFNVALTIFIQSCQYTQSLCKYLQNKNFI